MLAGSRAYDKNAVPWEELQYVTYAREFGWTPQQVDEIPLRMEPWILPIHEAIEQSQAKRLAPPSTDGDPPQGGRHRMS